MPYCRGRDFYVTDLFVLLQYSSLGRQEQNSPSNKLCSFENTTVVNSLRASHSASVPALSLCRAGGIPRSPTDRPSTADLSHESYWPLRCRDSELRAPWNFYLVPISLQFSLSTEKAGCPNALGVGTWYSFKSYLAVNRFIDD